jgi:4-diphosphocytidyl-2-C-methyl-D-erythritol kinase
MPSQVRSFAKVNLGLRIGPTRADGFHDLLTIYQTIALHDLIKVSIARGSGIEIRCDDPRVPRDQSNTCYRIVEKTLQALNAKGRVVIEIEKRLPLQGGMGGASSNAVAAMLALERALKKPLGTEDRLRIAAEVGSDLPLFLIGGTVLGAGRGEQVYPLEDLPPLACVAVTPEIGVSTPKAFAEWDTLIATVDDLRVTLREHMAEARVYIEATSPEGLDPEKKKEMIAAERKLTAPLSLGKMALLSRALSAWLSESYSGAPRQNKRGRAENPLLSLVRTGIRNDFEQVVFPEYPELNEIKKALLRAGAKYASLSGSGSTLYGLFDSREMARAAAKKLQTQGWAAQATVTLPRRRYWKKFLVSSS